MARLLYNSRRLFSASSSILGSSIRSASSIPVLSSIKSPAKNSQLVRILPQSVVHMHSLPEKSIHFRNINKKFRYRKVEEESDIKWPVKTDISRSNEASLTFAERIISASSNNGANSVLSPLSIQILLGMCAAGSTGTSKDQLLSFLRFDTIDELNSFFSRCVSSVLAGGNSSGGGPMLSCANAAWLDQSLSFASRFKDIIGDVYKGHFSHLDFQNKPVEAAKEINTWAEKETKGLIQKLISPDDIEGLTRLVLANALYFKGAWLQKFDPPKTKHHDFYLLDGNRVKAPFMTSRNSQFIDAYDGFKVLQLPYRHDKGKNAGRRFSMYLYLPDAKNGLPDLVKKVCSEPGFLQNHIPRTRVCGDFLIPKFKMSFSFKASKVLKELGLVSPFVEFDGVFSNTVDSPVIRDLITSNIFQKCVIEVNEEGSEAAAVSAAIRTASPPPQVIKYQDFVADHPFLFLIRENVTGLILFMGSVLDPLKL